ncbi:SCP2 sterol-binding domain-containing protein [Nocardioides sp. BP30]|uniref:SCP2 sterol-binding domain-containing protein n=1 Tax=Nocardioides sp. BP30 TaxID=3036374 RepID=UPI002469AD0E|nr:SCP2 sterol-binding domain-containing protein [Nocardioides sp. BP30]WGL50352.1 SCP2 sterol-binding domain-containing protein [Nocardioides sp. BP30]
MADATDRFFDELGRRGHEPMLTRLSATLRWDIVDGEHVEHRRVRVDRGAISVTSSGESADCVITAERAVCNDVIGGRTSALAALLRGAAVIEGDPELMVLAQRLFTRQRAGAVGRGHLPDGRPADA